jgi:hypothetical protein
METAGQQGRRDPSDFRMKYVPATRRRMAGGLREAAERQQLIEMSDARGAAAAKRTCGPSKWRADAQRTIDLIVRRR